MGVSSRTCSQSSGPQRNRRRSHKDAGRRLFSATFLGAASFFEQSEHETVFPFLFLLNFAKATQRHRLARARDSHESRVPPAEPSWVLQVKNSISKTYISVPAHSPGAEGRPHIRQRRMRARLLAKGGRAARRFAEGGGTTLAFARGGRAACRFAKGGGAARSPAKGGGAARAFAEGRRTTRAFAGGGGTTLAFARGDRAALTFAGGGTSSLGATPSPPSCSAAYRAPARSPPAQRFRTRARARGSPSDRK